MTTTTPGMILLQRVNKTQTAIAGELGISTAHLSKIVNNDIRISARIAVRAETIYGIHAEDLLHAQVQCDLDKERRRLERKKDST